ncbi:hypothetical protein [Sporosarcina aquimarina]|uniref:EamA domain-containing protein n=1 Tax=Sporosarcina aquimarina TaxID=114975 RepID=A0ABU4G1M7_9BACL|nr:hypothetical protein [Sporosarcina aquimarina]MDW0110877.1 hypothetical protein [Sporosarcina aquimarina]
MVSSFVKLPFFLSIFALLFTYSVYLLQLFTLGDAYMGWLLISIVMGSALLFSSTHPKSWMNRRSVMNTFLVLNTLSVGYGTFLALGMLRPYSSILSIIGYLLVAGIVIGIYATSLVREPSANAKVLHGFTITIGIALSAGTLYFVYIFYLFSEEGNSETWKLFVPLGVYGIVYIIQMKALKIQRTKVAYSIAAIQILIPVVLMLLWKSLAAGEGIL